jgi:hypothetical protein
VARKKLETQIFVEVLQRLPVEFVVVPVLRVGELSALGLGLEARVRAKVRVRVRD